MAALLIQFLINASYLFIAYVAHRYGFLFVMAVITSSLMTLVYFFVTGWLFYLMRKYANYCFQRNKRNMILYALAIILLNLQACVSAYDNFLHEFLHKVSQHKTLDVIVITSYVSQLPIFLFSLSVIFAKTQDDIFCEVSQLDRLIMVSLF